MYDSNANIANCYDTQNGYAIAFASVDRIYEICDGKFLVAGDDGGVGELAVNV